MTKYLAEKTQRVKELIKAEPSIGKNRINSYLRAEFGSGLRDGKVLEIKNTVAGENPNLLPDMYTHGGVSRDRLETYHGWVKAGFLPFEAREFVMGHGDRYKNFDYKAIYDSAPGRAARATRTRIIEDNKKSGWSWKQNVDNIVNFYKHSKDKDPWEHIRAEYHGRKVVDFKDYRQKIAKRAQRKQKRLFR